MRTWQIRSKVRQTQEKRRRPNALQDQLQQSTEDREAKSGLAEAEVGSITLWCGRSAAGSTSGGGRSIQGLGGGSGTLADEFTLNDASTSTGLLLEFITGDGLLRLDVEASLDVLELWQLRATHVLVAFQHRHDTKYLRSEVSREVNGTSNRCESWETDGVKSSVVGNLVCTSDALQDREGNVGKLAVSNNGQRSNTGCEATNGGQVWCTEAVHVVSVESKRSVDSGQRRHLDARDISEGHVGSPDQVGESDSQLHAIGIDVNSVGDVGDLGVEGLQVVVVVNSEGADSVQVDTIQVAQEGVTDGDTAGL